MVKDDRPTHIWCGFALYTRQLAGAFVEGVYGYTYPGGEVVVGLRGGGFLYIFKESLGGGQAATVNTGFKKETPA